MPALLDPTSVSPSSGLVANHLRLGASTGAFFEQRGDWAGLVRQARRLSGGAVELAALSGDELPGLVASLREGLRLPFHFVSVHAPTKHLIADDDEIAATLARLPLSVEAMVLHPDVLRRPEAYRRLGHRAVIENMDARKRSGATVDDLVEIFSVLPDARFCLDVAHVWSIDPEMDLAHELLDAFRGRLSHLHVSSLSEDRFHHVALTDEHEELFAPVLARCLDVPWILEGV